MSRRPDRSYNRVAMATYLELLLHESALSLHGGQQRLQLLTRLNKSNGDQNSLLGESVNTRTSAHWILAESGVNPFTPKSDQFQSSPGASPEI